MDKSTIYAYISTAKTIPTTHVGLLANLYTTVTDKNLQSSDNVLNEIQQVVTMFCDSLKREPAKHLEAIGIKLVHDADVSEWDTELTKLIGDEPSHPTLARRCRDQIMHQLSGFKSRLFSDHATAKEIIERYELTRPLEQDDLEKDLDFGKLVELAAKRGLDLQDTYAALPLLFNTKPEWFKEWYEGAVHQAMRVHLLSEYDISIAVEVNIPSTVDLSTKAVKQLVGLLLEGEVTALLR